MQSGKPTQNAHAERFSKARFTGMLDCLVIDSLRQVRDMTADCLHRCNHHRPHDSLRRISPVDSRVECLPYLCLSLAQEFEGTSMPR